MPVTITTLSRMVTEGEGLPSTKSHDLLITCIMKSSNKFKYPKLNILCQMIHGTILGNSVIFRGRRPLIKLRSTFDHINNFRSNFENLFLYFHNTYGHQT